MLVAAGAAPGAQDAPARAPAPAEFEVVSIKPSDPNAQSGGIQNLPDGTFIMRNSGIRSILMAGSPVPVREVEGFPEWAARERYDIIAKPPEGYEPSQRGEMFRRMLTDRLQLRGHVEQRERTVFALVVARSDGRLGPQLKPSTLDCAQPAAAPTGILRPPDGPPEARCGVRFSAGEIVAGGVTFDQLVLSLTGQAGGQVINRTGLEGYYALTLHFAPRRNRSTAAPSLDDLPDFSTALQEQLGLRLQPEKAVVPVFVVDHIERPSPN